MRYVTLNRPLLFSAICLFVAFAQEAHAQSRNTIRLIVPYVPGGSTDTVARLLAPSIEKELGTPVVVENHAGGAGVAGLQVVARAKPDGTTFGVTDSAFVVGPALVASLPYDTRRDFREVVLIAASPQVLTVNPALPVRSVKELVDLARRDPGSLSFASAGAGTAIHIAGEQLKLASKTSIVHVPYRGLGPALTDVMGGHVSMVFGGPHSVRQQVDTGNLRALAITGSHRSPAMPTVPTFAEAGYPTVDMVTTNGIVAPAGTSDAIVERLNRAVVQALRTDKQLQKRFEELGLEPLGGSSQDFTRWVDQQLDKWKALVRQADIKVD